MHYMHYMHYKDYIHHDFYVYSPVLLTQYLGHCWHTPCTELYILRISAWLLRKPPLPCHRGGKPSGWGRGGVWGSLLIYIYITIHNYDLQVLPSASFELWHMRWKSTFLKSHRSRSGADFFVRWWFMSCWIWLVKWWFPAPSGDSK